MRSIKKDSIKKRLVFLLILVSLFFCIIAFIKTGHVLAIRGEDGVVRGIFPLHENETFQIRFNHSLYHVPQYEKWELKGGGLVLKEVRFGNLAAAEYYNTTLPYQRAGDGSWFYIVPKRPADEKILIRVGYIANHTLLWRGQDMPFARYITPGNLAVLELEKRPLIWTTVWRAIKS
jgi:hypothetical protein